VYMQKQKRHYNNKEVEDLIIIYMRIVHRDKKFDSYFPILTVLVKDTDVLS
jgi:hypothetical protein